MSIGKKLATTKQQTKKQRERFIQSPLLFFFFLLFYFFSLLNAGKNANPFRHIEKTDIKTDEPSFRKISTIRNLLGKKGKNFDSELLRKQ